MKNNELIKFYLEHYTQFIYDVWEKMGISEENKLDRIVLDIEPLFVYSIPVARFNRDFFELIINFFHRNVSYISITRLKLALKIFLKERDGEEREIYQRIFKGIFKKFLINDNVRWKNLKSYLHDETRKNIKNVGFFLDGTKLEQYDAEFLKFNILYPPFHINEDKAFQIIPNSMNNLRFLIRNLWGTNVRSEIIVYLLTNEVTEINPIAAATGYSKRAIRNIIYNMAKSTMINSNYSGKRQPEFKISHEKWWYFLTGRVVNKEERPKWFNWLGFLQKTDKILKLLQDNFQREDLLGDLNSLLNDLFNENILRKRVEMDKKVKNDHIKNSIEILFKGGTL